MAEATLCATKPKNAKKKQREISNPLSLDSIPEEGLSSQDLQLVYKTAAETVFKDIVAKAVHLSFPPSNDLLPENSVKSLDIDVHDNNATVAGENNTILTVVSELVELVVRKDEAEEEDLTKKLDSIDSNSENLDIFKDEITELEIDEPEEEEVTLSENASLNNTPQSLSEIASKEDLPQEEHIKPSVFVGRNKLYSSSLQIGRRWDRTKYNVVLLPDLSKVVYPDLDTLMSSKTTSMRSSSPAYYENQLSYAHDLPILSRKIDRSNKPAAAVAAIQRANSQMKMHTPVPVAPYSQNNYTVEPKPPVMVAEASNKLNTPKMDFDAHSHKYTDFCIDDIYFRVFMNPLTWHPNSKNHQKILFKVGPLYYEEHFTNCDSTDGLLTAIKERAEELTNEQLVLASSCLLTDPNYCIPLASISPYNTVIIYDVPSKIDPKVTRIKFGVNEGFYEENFENCKSLEHVYELVKDRSHSIAILQGILKTKAYLEPDPTAEKVYSSSSSSEIILEAVMNLNEELDEYKDYLMTKKRKKSTKAITSTAQDQQKTSGLTGKFKSMRNWFKGTFSKQPNKSSADAVRKVLRKNKGLRVSWKWSGQPVEEIISLPEIKDNSKNTTE